MGTPSSFSTLLSLLHLFVLKNILLFLPVPITFIHPLFILSSFLPSFLSIYFSFISFCHFFLFFLSFFLSFLTLVFFLSVFFLFFIFTSFLSFSLSICTVVHIFLSFVFFTSFSFCPFLHDFFFFFYPKYSPLRSLFCSGQRIRCWIFCWDLSRSCPVIAVRGRKNSLWGARWGISWFSRHSDILWENWRKDDFCVERMTARGRERERERERPYDRSYERESEGKRKISRLFFGWRGRGRNG